MIRCHVVRVGIILWLVGGNHSCTICSSVVSAFWDDEMVSSNLIPVSAFDGGAGGCDQMSFYSFQLRQSYSSSDLDLC